MITDTRSVLFDHILDTCDFLEAQGVDVSPVIKRRDPIEPGRRVKEKKEDELFVILMRYFRRTKKRTREFFEATFPDRKALEVIPSLDVIFKDDKYAAELFLWLMAAAESGIVLFELQIGFGISSAANIAAADWAGVHASELIEFLTSAQRNTIQRSISAFIEKPGLTIGDVVNDLVADRMFTEERALRIAVSEVTNAFSEADRIAGEQLQIEFPDTIVEKTWWTNNDGLVCLRCAPLHQQTVPINSPFINKPLGLEFVGPPGHVANCRCWRSTTTRAGKMPNA